MISFYNGDVLAHSITINPETGEVWSKSNHGEERHYDSLDDYYNALSPNEEDTNRELYDKPSIDKKYYNFKS